MTTQTNLDGTEAPAACASHEWSSEAVSAVIVKSSHTIKLTSNDGGSDLAVHKELLCFLSPYYTAALKGNFSEAQKDCLSVDLAKETLDSFVAWIYTGNITWTGNVNRTVDLYVKLYIFADQVNILALRRQIIDLMAEDGQPLPYYSTLLYALTNLLDKSPFRRYLLDAFVTHWDPSMDENDSYLDTEDEDPSRALPDFLYQVMKGVALRRKLDAPGCPCCKHTCE